MSSWLRRIFAPAGSGSLNADSNVESDVPLGANSSLNDISQCNPGHQVDKTEFSEIPRYSAAVYSTGDKSNQDMSLANGYENQFSDDDIQCYYDSTDGMNKDWVPTVNNLTLTDNDLSHLEMKSISQLAASRIRCPEVSPNEHELAVANESKQVSYPVHSVMNNQNSQVRYRPTSSQTKSQNEVSSYQLLETGYLPTTVCSSSRAQISHFHPASLCETKLTLKPEESSSRSHESNSISIQPSISHAVADARSTIVPLATPPPEFVDTALSIKPTDYLASVPPKHQKDDDPVPGPFYEQEEPSRGGLLFATSEQIGQRISIQGEEENLLTTDPCRTNVTFSEDNISVTQATHFLPHETGESISASSAWQQNRMFDSFCQHITRPEEDLKEVHAVISASQDACNETIDVADQCNAKVSLPNNEKVLTKYRTPTIIVQNIEQIYQQSPGDGIAHNNNASSTSPISSIADRLSFSNYNDTVDSIVNANNQENVTEISKHQSSTPSTSIRTESLKCSTEVLTSECQKSHLKPTTSDNQPFPGFNYRRKKVASSDSRVPVSSVVKTRREYGPSFSRINRTSNDTSAQAVTAKQPISSSDRIAMARKRKEQHDIAFKERARERMLQHRAKIQNAANRRIANLNATSQAAASSFVASTARKPIKSSTKSTPMKTPVSSRDNEKHARCRSYLSNSYLNKNQKQGNNRGTLYKRILKPNHNSKSVSTGNDDNNMTSRESNCRSHTPSIEVVTDPVSCQNESDDIPEKDQPKTGVTVESYKSKDYVNGQNDIVQRKGISMIHRINRNDNKPITDKHHKNSKIGYTTASKQRHHRQLPSTPLASNPQLGANQQRKAGKFTSTPTSQVNPKQSRNNDNTPDQNGRATISLKSKQSYPKVEARKGHVHQRKHGRKQNEHVVQWHMDSDKSSIDHPEKSKGMSRKNTSSIPSNQNSDSQRSKEQGAENFDFTVNSICCSSVFHQQSEGSCDVTTELAGIMIPEVSMPTAKQNIYDTLKSIPISDRTEDIVATKSDTSTRLQPAQLVYVKQDPDGVCDSDRDAILFSTRRFGRTSKDLSNTQSKVTSPKKSLSCPVPKPNSSQYFHKKDTPTTTSSSSQTIICSSTSSRYFRSEGSNHQMLHQSTDTPGKESRTETSVSVDPLRQTVVYNTNSRGSLKMAQLCLHRSVQHRKQSTGRLLLFPNVR